MTRGIPVIGRVVQAINNLTEDSTDEPTAFVVDLKDPKLGWLRVANDLDKETAEELAEVVYMYQDHMGFSVSSDNVRAVPESESTVSGVDWGQSDTLRTAAVNNGRTQVLRG